MKGTAAGAVALMLVSAAAIGSPYKCFHADGSVSFSDRSTSAEECVSLDRGEREREATQLLADALAGQLRVAAAQARACTDAVMERGLDALRDDRNCVSKQESEETQEIIRRLGGMPLEAIQERHRFAIRDVGRAHTTLAKVIQMNLP